MRAVNSAVAAFALVYLCSAVSSARSADAAKAAQISAPSATAQPNHSADAGTVNSPVLQRRDVRYRLYPSDQISVSFPLTPEFNQTVTIEPDGYASLSGAGDVHLAGLTTQESVEEIKAAYAKVLHDPIVTVELKDFDKPFFVVTGQVNHPGKYDLRGPTSAPEAIAIAGGMNDNAKPSQALLFRRVDGGRYEVTRIDLKRVFDGHEQEVTELLPGDMLYVPKSVISKIQRFIPSSGFGAYYQLQP
jgi:protein involved in polysaccharide export with SLBB domain